MFEDLFSHVVCDLVYRQVFVQHPKQRPTDSDGFVLGQQRPDDSGQGMARDDGFSVNKTVK